MSFRRANPADLDDLLEHDGPSAPFIVPAQPSPKSVGGVLPKINVNAENIWDSSITLEPIECDNLCDFSETFWPEMQLYPWQELTQRQLSGQPNGVWHEEQLVPTPAEPLLYSLVAANGSGKSAQILARYALWYIACKCNAKVIVTSASYSQLKNMTFRAIHRAAEDLNAKLGEKRFEITEVKVTCAKTRGTIFGFATDQPGRAEGYHPDDGGEMCVLVDEAKTITDEMFAAFSRFSGYSQWIEVSSPGSMDGHFYKRSMMATRRAGGGRNDALKLGEVYTRKVTAFECPNITPAHIESVRQLHGEHSMAYKTGILAEFSSLDDSAVIRQEKTIYSAPQWHDLSQPKRAGLDLSLGGDETVLVITHGNKVEKIYTWHIEDSAYLVQKIIATLKIHDIDPANVNADGGGLGKVVIQMLWAEGCMVNKINNESAAAFKKEFLNRGMEMYWKVMRLVEEQVLILPHDDATLMHQLVTRQYQVTNGKLKLQSKAELSTSPDRADAYVLAYASVDIEEVLTLWRDVKSKAAPKFFSPENTAPTISLEALEAGLERRRAKSADEGRPLKSVGLFHAALSPRGETSGVISNAFTSGRVARFTQMLSVRSRQRSRF